MASAATANPNPGMTRKAINLQATELRGCGQCALLSVCKNGSDKGIAMTNHTPSCNYNHSMEDAFLTRQLQQGPL